MKEFKKDFGNDDIWVFEYEESNFRHGMTHHVISETNKFGDKFKRDVYFCSHIVMVENID